MAQTRESSNFILTADALAKAIPGMDLTTRAIHADDFVSPHRAIAPAMHVGVTYRYDRNPDNLVQGENIDVRLTLHSLPQMSKNEAC